MTSRRKLRFTVQARGDLRSILRFSAVTWGELQRDEYASRIERAVQELMRFPDLGRSRDDLSAGLRSHPVGVHIVYYRVDARAVSIIRILHAKMDTTGQIEE